MPGSPSLTPNPTGAHQPANDYLVARAPVGAPKLERENGVIAAKTAEEKMDELMSDIGELGFFEESVSEMDSDTREELADLLERLYGTAQAALALVRGMA